ncbi:MAG: FAD-binding oxidoreductase [Pseudomonadales bacterium]
MVPGTSCLALLKGNDTSMQDYDVVIVGAGIVGVSAAYFLSQRDLSVVVLDKGALAFEQSSRNWGWIRQNGRNLRELPLAVASRELWQRLADELEEDIGWRSGGNLHLGYDDAELATFERWRRAALERGLATEVLSVDQVLNFVPGLKGDFVGAIYSPTDGQADPHRAVQALARAAAAHGVSVREQCAVEAIQMNGGGVEGVLTREGLIRSERVILAAGAWSSRLLWPLGIHLPQRKYRSTVFATTPTAPLTSATLWAGPVALRQALDGSWIVAGGGSILDLDLDSVRSGRAFRHADPDTARRGRLRRHYGREILRDAKYLLTKSGFWERVRAEEPEPNYASAFATLNGFRGLHDAFKNAGMQRIWAGNIDYTPDAVPVIDAPEQTRGLVISTGFSGHGFALGPVGGKLASELALDEAPSVDVSAFSVDRFARGETHQDVLKF